MTLTPDNAGRNTLPADSRRPAARVFEWATGQDDNIGDSLLRRPSLADARARGTELHVFHGPSTPTFDTGLGLAVDDVTYREFRPWVLRALRSGFQHPTLIVPNAGEVKVSRRGAVRIFVIWAVSLAPRTRVLWFGAGVPGSRSIWSVPYRLLARRANFAAFRDAESVELLRQGVPAPDWGFALGSSVDDWPASEQRSRLSVILRGDRPAPSAEWVQWLTDTANRLNLTPTFVAQVRRDNELAETLATKTSGEAIVFATDVDHAVQEDRVRAVYRETLLAVGDRLHGLIVAATEGAVPLGWVESSTGKISRHFDTVDMPFVGRREGVPASSLPEVTDDDLTLWSASLAVRITEARSRIAHALTQADDIAPRRQDREPAT